MKKYYWQHEETGRICETSVNVPPSERWYKVKNVREDFDFEKFKRNNRRNIEILDKVFEIMKPIFEETDSVEISVKDGRPQLRYTHKKADK